MNQYIILHSCANAVIGRSWPYNQEGKRAFNPNRSLERYRVIRYREDNFQPAFIFLLVSCLSFVLDVACCAIEQANNNLLNNQMKSVQ